MSNSFEKFLQEHECLLDEMKSSDGTRRFPINIPKLQEGRSIDAAWLEIPPSFASGGLARVSLPKKYILKIPHIEHDGHLCIDGDPGVMSGASLEERLEQVIDLFYSSFLEPWSNGLLDNHFSIEAMNYWAIHYSRRFTSTQPIVKVFTTDHEPDVSRVYKSTFIENRRIVIAGDDSAIRTRYASSLSSGSTISSVMVAEIPIAFPFTPDNWPKNVNDIQRLITVKLGADDAGKFLTSVGRRERDIHKIVVFRAPGCAFGYLLPGGPPTKVKAINSVKSLPNRSLIPLNVERLDVGWTTGRDQHPEYIARQLKHVLIIGAGALGSPVAEQMAKSGVGKLTLVDDDNLSSANIGRHTLGANSIGYSKVEQLAQSISVRWPSCNATGVKLTIHEWLKANSIKDVDIILDLTGEPEVRSIVDQKRNKYPTGFLIAWMEPYVAAAHVCLLTPGTPWLAHGVDKLDRFNTVDWPLEVIASEPSCSSNFQSYTSAAALHAVALTTEAALELIDNKVSNSSVRHWIRGQQYLDKCFFGLKLRDWASFASDADGVIREFSFD
ncbi:HesA/MoeB/ThiF family protein [Vibrio parahaemolyticus]|uniref:HesA/MoeB/ThiF family protein n=1 Tax=Vibrio parahaemolyticus TaxID=670 RepID=UPI00226AC87C|nr:ThiF family adenylyltransferase [Vibrio parahaemolyticus]MCX8859960.1 ThiF family adenylyltransferase [Vibrio parahaemolyticus]MCX8865134.1 ThiF family adenylyltransferase [Vibrio parahaemolyticus]MCX8870259.1 ThiF family adenylyltransferase [Vibrio parahaemolyticus]MCX8900474.1 ThiF family adenylyltransferase [Vibrio parahaemolyticus]MCX8920774.1 ThiF family adenylyltransferase [Vibrio parahaemolyticus]